MKRVLTYPASIIMLSVLMLTAVLLSPVPALQAQDAQPVDETPINDDRGEGLAPSDDGSISDGPTPAQPDDNLAISSYGRPQTSNHVVATDSGAIGADPGSAIPESNRELADDASPNSPTASSLACTNAVLPHGACTAWDVNEYQDISGTGQQITQLTDNGGSYQLGLDFSFNFYGTDYTTIWINPNGTFTFGAADSDPTAGQALPNADGPDNMIAAWWEDLDPTQGGTVHYQRFGESPYRYWVIQFQDVAYHNQSLAYRVSFQLKLYETTDHFQISYIRADSDLDGIPAAVGYENSTGSSGIDSFYDFSMNVPATVIFYKPEHAGDGCFTWVKRGADPDLFFGAAGNFSSDAIQDAVNAAHATDTIGIAGNCSEGAATTNVYVNNKNITFNGGYKNDFTVYDPIAYPTILTGMGVNRHFVFTGGTVILNDLHIMRGNSAFTGDNRGGSIFINSGAVYINTSTVTDNRSNRGGAIYALDWLRLNEDTKIYRNSSTGHGGAIYSTNSVLFYNAWARYNTAAGDGGAVYITSAGDMSLAGLSAADYAWLGENKAAFGGAIMNHGIMDTSNHVYIQDNEATTSGGGIYSSGTLEFYGAGTAQYVRNNDAAFGGGIYSSGTIDSFCTSADCYDFYGNTATSNGGGIYLNEATATDLYRISVGSGSLGNTAVYGGGIYNSLSTITLNETTIQYNNATAGNGGGILNNGGTVNSSNSTLIQHNNATSGSGGGLANEGGGLADLDNTEFNGNDAINGGGIWNDGSTLDMDGGSIHHGTASTAGGGIRNFGSGDVDLDSSTAVYNNSAPNGGGLYSTSGSVRLLWNNDFYNNTATTGNGGGIYSTGQLQIWNESDLYNNTAHGGNGGGLYSGGTIYAQDITVHGNAAVSGAGIYHFGSSATIRSGSDIYNNTASSQGGGIYDASSGTSHITGSKVRDNEAPNGGGIYNSGGTITVNSGHVSYNTASDSGGGIWNNNTLNINNSYFQENTAANNYGGAIKNRTGLATIHQSEFRGNEAGNAGGAIENSSSGTLQITESTFRTNFAPTGGALWVGGNGGSVTNSTFSNNYHPVSGDRQGGAIFNSYSPLPITNSTFSGNGLNGLSGADLYINGATVTLSNSILANSAGVGNCVNVGTLTNGGHNLIEDGSCSTEIPDAVTGDPKLLALADNGGGTTPSGIVPTHMLGSGSPAVNNGNCNNGALATSQNGVARLNAYPQFCDIGAVEFLAVGTPLLTIGRDFRTMDVTQNAGTGTQAVNIPLNEIDKNFSDYDGGQLFDRFCIDFGQLQTDLALGIETDCTVWNGGVSPGGNADISAGGTRSVNVYNSLRNSVGIQQEQAFRNSFYNPLLVGQSISDTLDAVREVHYTGMIYANEFYADAIRYQLYFTPTNNVDGINNEIGLMEQAYTQYNIVANSMALLGERELPAGKTVSNYYTAEDLEMFALATTRQADVALEIAQRLQKIDPIANSDTAADRLNAEYGKQQRNLEIFIAWLNANYPEPTYNDVQREAIYENNRGRNIAIGMEKLSRWADDIRSSDNPFGYPNEYIPRTTYLTMVDRTYNFPTVPESPFSLARTAEEAARDEARSFEENALSMTNALTALNEEFEAQRLDLCGIEASGNWTDPCDGGAMARNRAELVAAARGVDLAYQQVANYSQLILIEQERVGAVTIELSNAGQTISLAQLQIGKLNSIQQVTTDFVTDQESERTGTRAEAKVTNRTTVTVSSDPFENGAKNETEIEASVATWTETESETTTGTTQETIRNPNLEKIAEQESRQLLREWESQATIENANSSAEIKRLLLEQSDALISLDIATAEFNAVLADHNLLVAQWEDLQGDYPDALENFQSYFDRPSRRLIHDATSADFKVAFANLQNYAYLTAKALEYDLLDPSLIPYNDLYRARRVSDIQTFMNTLAGLYGAIGYDFNTNSLTTRYVSVVTDVLGLDTAYLTTLILSDTFTVDPLAAGWPSLPQCAGPTFTLAQLEDLRHCLFQEFLNNNLDGDIYEIPFSTEIGRIYDSFTWNARITNSNADNPSCPLCDGVSVDMRTTQTGISTPPFLRINYLGMGTYLNADEEVVRYRPGPTRLVGQAIPEGFPNTSTFQVASTFVNGGGGGTEESGFYLLSAVNNSWRLDMDRTSISNQGLDFNKITDFVISIQIEVKTVQGSRRAELEAMIRQAQLNRRPIDSAVLDEYAAIKAQPYQPAPFTAAEKEQLAEMFAIMAPDAITQTTYIDPLVPHGAYQGSMLAMGFAELGVVITATNELSVSQPLVGSLCTTCSVLYTTQPLTGYFTNTGTPTNTFFLSSAPIPMVVDGPLTGTVQITKTYIFEGLVIDGGNIISGTYREVVTDTKGIVGTTYVGTFSMSRWDRTPGAVTPTVSLSVGPGGFPTIFWAPADENCNYQLYHSRNPYFVNYSRQLATSTSGTGYIDTSAAAVHQPLYYNLRAFSCSANLDYLQQDADFYKDSNTIGVFVFQIAP